ncbi:MAG: sulfotransferase family protein [Pseudomonadales bacterium]
MSSIAENILDAQHLLAEARKLSGLSDFGDESFLKPFSVLTHALCHEARLTDGGLQGQKNRLLGLLVNRLRVEEYYKNYPEIDQERIVAPCVIVGLPRTGTTMIFRLIASDLRFLHPRFYEVRHPAPLPGWNFDGDDPRVALTEEEIRQTVSASPELESIHPLSATGAEEEINLLEHSFYSTVPEAFNHVPSYAKWLEEHDNSPGYAYLERLLKFLQWQKKQTGEKGERWILKTPHHLHHMQLLLNTFPDAKVVLTHRDPLQTIPSVVSFHRYLYQLSSDVVDIGALASHWKQKFARSMTDSMRIQDRIPDCFLNVQYKTTVTAPMKAVQRVYDFIGVELTETVRKAMETWQEENRRDKRPPHQYAMADFGFTEDELKAAFVEYRRRFIEDV